MASHARDDHPATPRTTLAHVAERAGVSRATASRALAGNPRISEATRANVLRAAEQLDYVPNQTARSLRLRKTRTLGLLLSDLADPDHAHVGAGFEQAAGAMGYSVLVVAARKRIEDEGRAVRALQERGTDGICIASSSLDPVEVRHVVRPTPVISVQPDYRDLAEELERLPDGVVRSDDVAGVGQAVRHLLVHGYRDIAYLGVGHHATNTLRRAAADRALREQVDRPMRTFRVADEAWRRPAVVAEALGSVLPEAIVCYDDKVAIALMDGLRSRGLRVPHDIAVVGYDDIPFASFSNPRLTTIATPAEAMGALAAEALVAALGSGELPPARTLPVELVVRESSSVARAAGGPAVDEYVAGSVQDGS